ncbi:hypothetical protein [Salinibacterium sp. SWN167]|uniref:hypothetical protein n=1 Tax=Salinibacterium sp. SWN167 TaxID=2792054 RepID=UPI0018CFEB80|nr:hypothetical protein [Salinibacterium sp. SWN167]MBH0082923.1 hypothetical protein [Salinibacterium sp. SWN167]
MPHNDHSPVAAYREILKTRGIPFEEAVEPPIYTRAQIRERLLAATGSAPAALVDWFSWHNGVKDVGRIRSGFFLDYDPIPFDEAITTFSYRLLPGIEGSRGEHNPHFPILSRAGAGDLMMVDLIEGDALLYYFWGLEKIAIADSLAALLRKWGGFVAQHVSWDSETQFVEIEPPWGDLGHDFRSTMGLN